MDTTKGVGCLRALGETVLNSFAISSSQEEGTRIVGREVLVLEDSKLLNLY